MGYSKQSSEHVNQCVYRIPRSMEPCKELVIKKKINAIQQPLASLNCTIWIHQECPLTADNPFSLSVSIGFCVITSLLLKKTTMASTVLIERTICVLNDFANHIQGRFSNNYFQTTLTRAMLIIYHLCTFC